MPKISIPLLVSPAAFDLGFSFQICAAVLKLKLANSTEAELKSLQSSLRGAAKDTASELQRSVFKK